MNNRSGNIIIGEPNQFVYMVENPGKRGITTGRSKSMGSFQLVEVDFGPNDRKFKSIDLLSVVPRNIDILDHLKDGRFGNVGDLRRIITYEKIKCELTNVFYSMETSNTEYFTHQFRAVLKFIESTSGRLLIADEVGLGKTIEAIFIWKELQARENAQHLLVVCPAMLREKWRSELKNRFNIDGDIVNSQQLVRKLFESGGLSLARPFVFIASYESIRPPKVDQSTSRARLATYLNQPNAPSLFDLVIFDEAHHLRNPSTSNNSLYHLLNKVSQHMVLLTATPIQMGSDNLYQLLRLIEPDVFYNSSLFDEMLQANKPLVKAIRLLWNPSPDIASVRESIRDALQNEYFKSNATLRVIEKKLTGQHLDTQERIELIRQLDSCSLLNSYITRMRKKEILEQKVIRSPQTLNVTLSSIEKQVYDYVSKTIRDLSVGRRGVEIFTLHLRQRQMTSSMVPALTNWHSQEVFQDMLWEDSGIDFSEQGDLSLRHQFVPDLPHVDIEDLELNDSKYGKLQEFLRNTLNDKVIEKIVIFSYFRGTLEYLERRLKSDGFDVFLIMGGMGDEKIATIDKFRDAKSSSILLSSEVGSEGIDLQFCRMLVNYDLPWNPMRIEQRIGRLDRLGQKAEKISIVNLSVNNTIEDRVLTRLYDRIEIFRESIGDLEEILGQETERLMQRFLDPELSEDQREKLMEQNIQAIVNQRAEQNRLEENAVNLFGFTDVILNRVQESREKRRWLSAQELISLVNDFFEKNYKGTTLSPHKTEKTLLTIDLSNQAKLGLEKFIRGNNASTPTRLHRPRLAIPCQFDPRKTVKIARNLELIESTHPLIQWIRQEYFDKQEQLHPVAAIRLEESICSEVSGLYAFVVKRCSFKGIRKNNYLVHCVLRLTDSALLTDLQSESLINCAILHGVPFGNVVNHINLEKLVKGVENCDESIDKKFEEATNEFDVENRFRCEQQRNNAEKFFNRKKNELTARLERYEMDRKSNLIPMTKGLLEKERREHDIKLSKIEEQEILDPKLKDLAAGIIEVY